MQNKFEGRLVNVNDVIEAIDKHTREDETLDEDISVILEEVKTAFDKKRVIEKINREIEYHHEKSKIASMEIRAYSDGAERAYRFLRSIVEKGGIES